MRCTNCGVDLHPEDRFCRACGEPRPQSLRPFTKAERRFAVLLDRYRAGELNEAAYEAALKTLVIQRDDGYWMLGADSGEWYWYDGSRWIRREPPLSASPAHSAPAVSDRMPTVKAFPWKWVALGGGSMLVITLTAIIVVVFSPLLPGERPGPRPPLIGANASTPNATATSGREKVEVIDVAAPQTLPTSTAEPAQVATPTATPTTVPSPTPTSTSTPEEPSTTTPSPQPTPTPTLTPTPQSPSSTPKPTSPPASGALIDFEQWGTWRRGDQPYGELTQTASQVHSGRYAAELRYDFPITEDDFVVFVRPISLAGQPNRFSAWVYGDGSGHYVNVWIQDAQGETWSVHLGQVGSAGWRSMTGKLDPELLWPSGHVYGTKNGIVDYPIKFHALVLDRVGSGAASGQIYLDDISAWRSEAGGAATPTGGETTPTTVTETPASAGPLDFPEPTRLDGWEPVDGGYRATIILRISGGAPPFTIRHDIETFVTYDREYSLVFTASECAIVRTIVVESSDGQVVKHDYYIRAPWCN